MAAKKTKMTKDQRALAKMLDALEGMDAGAIRRLLRAAAIFHDVNVEEIRFVPQVVERYRPWWEVTTPVWYGGPICNTSPVSSATVYGDDANQYALTSGEARMQATAGLLKASTASEA